MMTEFIFKSLFVAAVVIAVAVVVAARTSVLPVIVATLTTFGAVILFSYYPNTIAIAIALPVVIPPLDTVWNSIPFSPEFTAST